MKLSYANEEAARLQSSQQLARVSSVVDQLSAQYANAANRSLALPVHTSARPLGLSAARSSEPLTRHPLANRGQSMDYDTAEDCESEGGTWHKQTARKKRRADQAQLSPPTHNVNTSAIHNSESETNRPKLWSDVAADAQPIKQRPVIKKKFVKIIGKSPTLSDNSSPSAAKIKSAKPYVKKRVLAIYNVDLTETVTTMEASIATACGQTPISCFQVKSRDENSNAFRLCINDEITEKFVNSTKLWASGIVIKPWTFKPKGPAVQAAAAAHAAAAVHASAAVHAAVGLTAASAADNTESDTDPIES